MAKPRASVSAGSKREAAQMLVGLLPVVGDLQDAREVAKKLGERNLSGAAVAGIGFLPFLGEGFQAAIKLKKRFPQDTVLNVDLDKLWNKLDDLGRARIAKGPGKEEKLKQFLKSAKEMNVPEIGASGGKIGVIDGRTRIAVLREMGVRKIPVAVNPNEADEVMRILK